MAVLRQTTALSGVAGIGCAETTASRGPTPVATALRALTLLGLLAAGVVATGHAARADGGQGGGNAGGGGGANSPTGMGGNGGDVVNTASGGGGGGGGTTGGNGGNGGSASGGGGGTGLGQPGQAGGAAGNGVGGGGGGGGGAHGFYGSGLPATAVQGGAGGNGGNGGNGNVGASGGGGGAGGYGAVVTGIAGGTLSVSATGGNGGHAGDNSTNGNGVAGGGSGGVGLYFTSGAAGANVTISAGVTGGIGGNGNADMNTAHGVGGAGGIGIAGSGLSLTVSLATLVQGGAGGEAFFGGAGGAGISGSGLSITDHGAILGGAGGAGDASSPGAGGVGITGANLTIDNTDGLIAGGKGNGGTGAQADAIDVTSGANKLTLGGGVLTGNIAVGGALSIDPGTAAGVSVTLPNTITNYTAPGGATTVGNLTKIGLGTLALTGTETYTGATTITAGTLEVDGSISLSSAVQVSNGATLSGTGQSSDGLTVILAGGTLSPGNPANPYGTLAVPGGLYTAAQSFYAVAIAPNANSRTDVTGTATLGGATVTVTAAQGSYATRRYTILTATAGGLGGANVFNPIVTSNLAFLMPTLTYDAKDVYLNITGNAASGSINYTTASATTNQYAVASGLNAGAKATGGNNAILNAFNQLTVPQAQAAFDAISGEGFAAAQNTAFGSTALFISSIFDQTTFYGGDGGSANQITLTAPQPGFSAYAPSDESFVRTPIHELADLPSRVAPIPAPVFVPQRTWRAWATGFGGVEDFSGNGVVGSAGQSDTIYGGTLGIDYQLIPNYLAGLAIGGSNGDFSVPGRATSGSTTGGHVAFYDLVTFGAFYAASTTSASFFSNQTTRTIAGFGGLGGETDRGNFRSNAYSSKVEFGRHFAAYGGLITPFASIELTELRSTGFTETPLSGPGLFALNVQGQDTASVPSLVGARFQTIVPLGNGLVLSPSLQVAWEHQFSPQRPVLAGLINLPGAVFLTNGASPARDSAAVKAGGELAITRQAALFANFDGDFSGVDRFYGGKGGFKYVW